MNTLPVPARSRFGAGISRLILALLILAVAGCGGNEPEERKAFIALLQDKVLQKQGIAIEPLSREEAKAIGKYGKHYALLENFQKDMARETAKNAKDLLSLAEMENLAAVAKAENSLKKAAKDALALRETTAALQTKTEKAKAELKTPEDLAPVFDAAYKKIVTGPAEAAENAFTAVHAVFAATLDLISFINTNNRDMEIADTAINVKNPGLMDDLNAKMSAVREKSAELRVAYAAMMKALLQ
ncbi:MAG: hypothetical protein DELT_02699 [Desulfovibrio sp.]